METKKYCYVFGANWNFSEDKEEGLLTEVKIPADDDEEAYARLEGLLGSACEHFRLNDVRDY